MGMHFDEPGTTLIPKPNEAEIPWQGLMDLRLSLISRGMLNEAVELFLYENSRRPPEERPGATLSLLKIVKSYAPLPHDRSVWVQAQLQFQLAGSYCDLDYPIMAHVQLYEAQRMLQYWCSLTGHPSIETLALYLSIRYRLLTLMDAKDDAARFEEGTKLLELMQPRCHALTTFCNDVTAEAAGNLAHEQKSAIHKAHLFRLHERQQVYMETVTKSIFELLMCEESFVRGLINDPRNARKAWEWLKGFTTEYKYFDIPVGLLSIESLRKAIAGGTPSEHEYKNMLISPERLKKAEELAPRKFGSLVGVTSLRSTSGNKIHDPSAGVQDLDEENWFQTWIPGVDNSKETTIKAMQLLMEWLIADIDEGLLEQDVLSVILHIWADEHSSPSGNVADSMHSRLRRLSSNPQSTSYMLYMLSNTQVIPHEVWSLRYNALAAWLQKPSTSPYKGRQYLRAVLQILRQESVCAFGERLEIKVAEYRKSLLVFSTTPVGVQEFMRARPAQWHESIARLYMGYHWSSVQTLHEPLAGLRLSEAETEFHVSLSGHHKDRALASAAWCQVGLAQLCLLRVYRLTVLRHKNDPARNDAEVDRLKKLGLQCLSEAEAFYSSKRMESIWSLGLDGLQARQEMTAFNRTSELPQIALHLLHAENATAGESDTMVMWEWVQRYKARSLADTMGLRGVVPSLLLEKVLQSAECKGLYNDMISLQQQLDSLPHHRRFAKYQEIAEHLEKMKQHAELRDVCDMQDGSPLTTEDISGIVDGAKKSVVFVDWFHLPGVFSGDGTLFMYTMKSSLLQQDSGPITCAPTVDRLNITLKEVGDWVAENLEKDGNRNFIRKRAEVTKSLDALVEPLARRSDPGDVLVFCPSNVLHRIPLHALQLPGHDPYTQILIFRNPVVYSHSHTLVRACFWNSQIAAEGRFALRPLIMSGIADVLRDTEETYSTGRASIDALSARFGITALMNERATKLAFINLVSTSRLIHIHSHITWDVTDPLDHHINFPTSSDRSEDGKLTAQEVFGLRFPEGTHASLIACSGALTRVGQGDEVVGLVPAFLHSNASSTVSTLWQTRDKAGAKFTQAFYDSYFEQSAALASGGGFIDLAEAFQEAIKKLYGDGDQCLIDWAGFVLHGYWMFYVSGGASTSH
jgi:CHAT domain-containing protein